MSINTGYCFVARISAESETFYLSNYPGGVTLDSENYKYFISSVGSADKIGNFGEDNQYGKCSMILMHGIENFQGTFTFNSTKVWNNKKCEIRQCKIGTDTTWADCANYYKGIIKDLKLSIGTVEFDVDDTDTRNEKILPIYTVEDIAKTITYLGATEADRLAVIPDNSKGKRIPFQYGTLTDTSNGVFAKGIPISNKIGMQEIWFDVNSLNSMNHIGVWENSLKRYFTGLSISTIDGVARSEYRISPQNSVVNFSVDSGTTLSADPGSVSTGIITLTVADYTKIQWKDETVITNWYTIPELLSTNILAIDNELFLIVEKPTSNTIYVERGYNNTTISAHDVGSIIYQSAQYSAKNLLSFTEIFKPSSISNQYYSSSASAMIYSGGWSNVVDDDLTNYIELTGDAKFINLDMQFDKIESTYTATEFYFGLKVSNMLNCKYIVFLNIYNPSDSTTLPNVNPETYNNNKLYPYIWRAKWSDGVTPDAENVNCIETIDRNGYMAWGDTDPLTEWTAKFWPRLIRNVSKDGSTPIITSLSSLSDLNKKWKISFNLIRESLWFPSSTTTDPFRLHALGIWVDFFLDFTSRSIMSSLTGRQLGTAQADLLDDIFNIGKLDEYPTEILVDILMGWLAFDATDFDSTSWRAVHTYLKAFPSYNGARPTVAISYGIDESEKGMVLVRRIAHNFLLDIVNGYDGKMVLLNLHKLQSTDSTYGYPSMTAYKISITNDILMPGTEKLITVQQTGTDMLYNDIIVHYKRNNSTDDFQGHYPVPDTYVLPESSITLSAARTKYFEGQKRTLEIESLCIYNEYDAQRLAEWHANDKAEVFFWVELTVDYEHFIRAGKATQYFPGDIFYLDGTYADIVFDSTHKIVVREVILKNGGLEIEIHGKTIDPISEFTSNSIGQNTTYQNTVDNATICQNTVDDLTIRQNKV